MSKKRYSTNSSKALWILFIGIVTGSLAIIIGACIAAL